MGRSSRSELVSYHRLIYRLLLGVSVVVALSLLIPPGQLFDDPFTTVLVDKNNQLLGARIARDGQWRFPDTYPVPDNFTKAILLFEDQYFYLHPGINPWSIVRAIYTDIKAGKFVTGGSTITMQVARMSYKNQPRTIFQKLREIWLALRIEIYYSKEEILRFYVNHAPYGGNVVGLPAASWRYYGRSPDHLSWAEFANLAVLPNAPSIIYPGKNDASLLAKRNRLLEQLFNKDVISQSEFQLGQLEPVPAMPKKLPSIAKHLLDKAVLDGLEGTIVKSSLTLADQKAVNEMVQRYHEQLMPKHIDNLAVIILDIHTGKVIDYVGNVNDPQAQATDVDIIQRRRSPGSLLKPFLYAMAIEDRQISPWQLLPDIPLYYRGFAPKNYDKKYAGAVAANEALRSSLNVPFVNILKDYGYERFHHNLTNIGMHSLNKEAGHYGLTLVLGGGEVTLWELASAYLGLARTAQNYAEDRRWPKISYLKEDRTTEFAKDFSMSTASAWHTIKTLQELRRPDEESNWRQFGSSRPIAWKTGTSWGHKDAWAIGMNSKYVVGVWVGNADGEGRPDLVGVAAASPLMFQLFKTLDGNAQFAAPPGEMKLFNLCTRSGLKAGINCPDVRQVLATVQMEKTLSCNYHQLLYLDESGTYQVNSSCYPIKKMKVATWFILPPAQAWYYGSTHPDYIEAPEFINGCRSGETLMEMIYPKNYTKVYIPIELDAEKGRVVFEVAHQNPQTKIYWHLDNEFIGITQNIHKLGLYPTKGVHKLVLVDEFGQELQSSFEVLNSTDS